MYIFNQESKPCLILTHKEILFRDKPTDSEMKRHPFEELEEVSLDHYYDAEHKLVVRLQVRICDQEELFSLELSSLDEAIDEILDILHEHFSNKTELSLPSSAWLKKIQNPRSKKRVLGLGVALLIACTLALHEFMPPSLQSLEKDALKVQSQEKQELCSLNARAAYAIADSHTVSIKNYCGMFGLWKETSSMEIPHKFLETEFSSTPSSQYLLQAEKQVQDQDYNLSVVTLEKAIYLDPDNSEAYILLGYSYYWKNEKDLALATTQKALDLDPNSAEANSAIGLLYIEEKEFEKAYKHYTKSSQIKPTAQTYMALGDLSLDLGDMNTSLKHYEDALSLDLNNTALLTQLGLLYWENLDYKKAAEVFEKSYRLAPQSIDNFLNYYEISMIEKTSLTPEDEKAFTQTVQEYKRVMMVFDTLKIVKLSIEQKEIIPALKKWAENYSNLQLKWSFTQIFTWLENSSLNEDEQHYVRKTIGFFIAYQQRYKLEHQEAI